MLKIEHKKNRVALIIQGRSRLWTREFSFALAVALTIHLAAAFLFHIDLGLFPLYRKPLPMAQVSSSRSSPLELMAEAENSLPVASFLNIERQKEPTILALVLPPISGSQPDIAYNLDSSSLSETKFVSTYQSTWHFSKGEFLPLKPLPVLTSQVPCRAVLRLQVLNSSSSVAQVSLIDKIESAYGGSNIAGTGQLIWLEWLISTQNRDLDQQIETLLKSLNFQVSSDYAIAQGILEVEFIP